MATGSTSKYALPYPVSTDPVRVAGDIEDLAKKIDEILQEKIEDISAAVWTSGTFSNGLNAPVYNDTAGSMSMSLSQDLRTSASPQFNGLSITTDISLLGNIDAGGNIDIASTKEYLIDGESVLSETTLGSSVVNSSLTSVGTITSGIWSASTIAANKGGTGQSSFSVGDILYASSSSELSKLPAVATGNALISGGTSSAPLWGKVGLSTHVSGILPVANGGTGVSESTGTGKVVLSESPTFTGTAVVDQLNVTSSSVVLLSSVSGVPNLDASIVVNRGSENDVSIRWNESSGAWQYTNDGTVYYNIATEQQIPDPPPDSLINTLLFGLM